MKSGHKWRFLNFRGEIPTPRGCIPEGATVVLTNFFFQNLNEEFYQEIVRQKLHIYVSCRFENKNKIDYFQEIWTIKNQGPREIYCKFLSVFFNKQ